MPARLAEILALAAEFEIPILEDAAEALGSRWQQQPLGSFGRVGIFSFNGNKILTTSGGGALVTHDPALAARARFLASQAKDPAPHYQHSEVGYNYRLSNLLAGIGRGQMELLPDRVKRRREIFQWYQEHLAGLPGLALAPTPEPAGSHSNRWLTTLLLDPEATAATPKPCASISKRTTSKAAHSGSPCTCSRFSPARPCTAARCALACLPAACACPAAPQWATTSYAAWPRPCAKYWGRL